MVVLLPILELRGSLGLALSPVEVGAVVPWDLYSSIAQILVPLRIGCLGKEPTLTTLVQV